MLSGTLPQHWDAPRLVQLDLHGNALTGRLPGGLAALPRLSYLQLQARRPRPARHETSLSAAANNTCTWHALRSRSLFLACTCLGNLHM